MKRAPIAVYLDYDGYVAVWSWRRKHDRRVEATGFDTEDAACEWLQKQGELYRPATSPAIEAKTKPQEQGKHTPGPWMVLDQPHADTFTFFVGAEGRAIASVFSHPGQKPKEAAIAQESADARLIAAAPDLLAALKDLLPLARIKGHRCPSCGRDNSGHGDACTSDDCPGVMARAAIARAEQEAA